MRHAHHRDSVSSLHPPYSDLNRLHPRSGFGWISREDATGIFSEKD